MRPYAGLTAAESVRDALVSSTSGARDITHAVSDIVADALSVLLRRADEWSEDLDSLISSVAQGAIEGAFEIGAPIAQAAHGATLGIVRASTRARPDMLRTLWKSGEALVRHATDLGCDAGAAARGVIEAALEISRERAIDPAVAVVAASKGALDSAHEAGSTAADRVRRVMAVRLDAIRAAPRYSEIDGATDP